MEQNLIYSSVMNVEFKVVEGGISSIEFNKEHLIFYLPAITVNENTEVILRNLVAYETTRMKSCDTIQFAEYVDLMCGIIDKPRDVELLRKRNIVEVQDDMDDEEIANLFNGIKNLLRTGGENMDSTRPWLSQGFQDPDPTQDRFRLSKIKIVKSDRDQKLVIHPNWEVDTRGFGTPLLHCSKCGLNRKPRWRYFHGHFGNKKMLEAALNSCFNLSGVDYLIENISRDLEFQDDSFATRTYKKKARNDPTMSSEYEQYLKADFVSHLHPKDFATFDVLGFWKAKENQFPVLSRMAMDILSVQASSVASESAFSTSGRLLTIRRTRLTPESLEMCMCLKDHLDAQERKQDTSPLELPLDVEEGVFNVEVQQNEATQLTDQEIALDASSDGSSGEPRHDYMMSSGAEDDQTGDGHDGSMSHGYY
ncbi:zinc finger BED domain-containing protein RICESLEEPER 2 [Tanacetum coccineum]|uniref:Zinc finger BED domain-containing protein RICESLEEPER 2 n=1 Tax=Tanacetum coccineum TaxID=301880 RepID=A0ABQ4X1P1_9ASTR